MFLNGTATAEIYWYRHPLFLHDAVPNSGGERVAARLDPTISLIGGGEASLLLAGQSSQTFSHGRLASFNARATDWLPSIGKRHGFPLHEAFREEQLEQQERDRKSVV